MFNVAIFDRDHPSYRRDWRAMLAPLNIVCVSSLKRLAEQECDLIIAHSLTQDVPSLINISEDKDAPLIIVSGSVTDRSFANMRGRVYQRKHAVRTGVDHVFGRCVQRYLSELACSGQDHWQTLEPQPWPEVLLSLYLLLTSAYKGSRQEVQTLEYFWKEQDALTFHDAFWNVAQAEFVAREGSSSGRWLASGFPSLPFSSTEEAGRLNIADAGSLLIRLAEVLPKPLEVPLQSDRKAPFTHTWLKNRLLAQLRSDAESWLARPSVEGVPSVIDGIPHRLIEVASFVKDAELVYSPAQLVASWPICKLPSNARSIIAAVCHRVFIIDTRWHDICSAIDKSAASLHCVAAECARKWTMTLALSERTAMLAALEQAANSLRCALERLPNGIPLHEE